MTDFEVKDILNVMCLRNQLIAVSKKQLMEIYQDYENYITFLDSVYVLSETDSAFLLYDKSFIDKVENIIQIHRYDTKDKEIKDVINSIISYLNSVKAYSKEYKQALMDAYLEFNQEARQTEIDTDQILLYLLHYDAVVVAGLSEGNMEIIEDDDKFLSSVNYLLSTVPELFDDPIIKIKTITRIDRISKRKKIFNNKAKTYSKITMKKFEAIKNKEE